MAYGTIRFSHAAIMAARAIEPMRWYSPSLRRFEWRNALEGDEEALTILNKSSRSRLYVEVYWE
jgi:hypothetical protein